VRPAEAERGLDGRRVTGLGRAASGAATVTAGIVSWAAWACASEPIGDSNPQSTGKLALPMARIRNIFEFLTSGASAGPLSSPSEQQRRANGSVGRYVRKNVEVRAPGRLSQH
jgi:hypothetical protein